MRSYAHIVREIVEAQGDYAELMFCFEGRWMNKEALNLARSVVYDGQGRNLWFLNPSGACCIPISIDV
jgi:hypothetical protein